MDLNAATNELVVGAFVLPLVLAVIMQSAWSQAIRALVFAAACVGTAALMHATEYNDTQSFVQSLLFVLISAGTLYRNFWRPSGVALVIEGKTDVDGDVRAMSVQQLAAR